MKKISLLLLLLLAACTGTPTPVAQLPTLAVLPSATPSPTPTDTASPTDTPLPTDTASPTPSDTPIPSLTPTPTNTYTLTPSQTITDTVTFTPSPTFTASPELDSLGELALLSERATILPPATLYNSATLTAVGYAALTHIADMTTSPTAPAPASAAPEIATQPPIACALPPPGGLASDPSVTASLGCPQGAELKITTAVEAFEHGTMIYLAGSPGSIYVLTLDGRFRRFDDTWVQGVDPESGGETPPLGLLEPKRGFGKVWRDNLDVRGSLGWAITEEQGATGSLQLFDHGRAVFLPQRGETELLIDDPGGLTGTWRSLGVSF